MRMTKQERVKAFTKSMKAIAKNNDKEAGHGQADELMADELEYLGYNEAIKTFRKMTRWCA